jgi:hypothetical protein
MDSGRVREVFMGEPLPGVNVRRIGHLAGRPRLSEEASSVSSRIHSPASERSEGFGRWIWDMATSGISGSNHPRSYPADNQEVCQSLFAKQFLREPRTE